MRQQLPPALTLIFDGYCSVCTRIVAWIGERDREQRITPVPCQGKDVTTRFGVSRAECESSVWTMNSIGERQAEGQAVVLVLAVLWNQPWLVTFGRLPGIRLALNLGYHLIAKNRGRLPGVTPWCVVHPDVCLPPHDA